MTRSLATRAAGGLLAVGLTVALAGCSDATASYCEELRAQAEPLDELAERAGQPGVDIFAESLDVFGSLRDAAADDIRDEWDTLYFAWEGLAEAFEDAGTTPAEFDPADPPPGLSDRQVSMINEAAAELRSQRVVAAGDGIEQHARDVCSVDLGL